MAHICTVLTALLVLYCHNNVHMPHPKHHINSTHGFAALWQVFKHHRMCHLQQDMSTQPVALLHVLSCGCRSNKANRLAV
jgi:hypothetical protein